MEKVIFLEILHPSGRVKSRTKLDHFPLTIGRDYTNDIIVEDRFVESTHLRLEKTHSGTLVAIDLDSKNGLFDLSTSKKGAQLEISSNQRIRIGQTILRFRDRAHSVPEAEALYSHGWMHVIRQPLWMAVTFLVSSLFIFLREIFEVYGKYSVNQMVIGVVWGMAVVLIFILIWAGIWSVLGRVLVQRFSFMAHCLVTLVAIVGFEILESLATYVIFSFSLGGISALFLRTLLSGFVGFYFFHRLFQLSTQMRTRKRIRVSIGVVIVVGSFIFGGRTISNFNFRSHPQFGAALKPPLFQFRRSQTIKEFLDASDSLKSKVDKLAKKR